MAQVTETAPTTRTLPRPIRRALGRVDRRLRGISALRSLGTLALVAALGAALGMALDFAWNLPQTTRWGVWLAWVVAVSGVALYGLSQVFGRRARAIELAAVIERGDPDLQERLTGAVGLFGENAHGSPALIAALTDDAAEHVEAIDLSRAAPSQRAWKRLALGVGVAGLVAAPPLINDDPCGQLAKRFLMPWAGLDRVSRFVVRVEPGDAVVAVGDDLAVSARVVSRFGGTAPETAATLEWTDANGKTRRTAMEPASGEERGFTASLPRLSGTVSYRVVSPSAESRRFSAQAIAPPSVASASAKVEPPAYTKMPATVLRDASRIVAFEDSRVTLTVTPSVPAVSAEVAWPGETKVVTRTPSTGGTDVPRVPAREPVTAGPGAARGEYDPWHPNDHDSGQENAKALRVPMTVSPDGKTLTVTLTASKTGDYAITLKESHGLTSHPEPGRRVVTRPDAPPVVALRGSEETAEARGDDTLRVAVAARDDVAVASVQLHYTIEHARDAEDSEREKGEVNGKLDGLDTASARGEVALGLKALKLEPGDVVAYRVRVADNRPGPRGPNVVWSTPRRLTVAANATPLWSKQSQAEREALKASLEAIKKDAVENRRQTEQLRYAADAVMRGNGEWDRDRKQALAQREAEARTLSEKLEILAHDFEDDPTFKSLARPARQVAKVESEAARATLDQARQAEDPAPRLAELRQADTRLNAVVNRLDELQRQFNEIAGREDDRRRLQDLADRQEQVAAHAEDGGQAPPDRIKLDQLEAEQNGVKADLDNLVKKSPAMKADVLDAQADEADALAKRAREIANRQREEARKSVDMSKQTEALRKLAEEQRAIEDDARRLAVDADQPLTENGRGRLNADAIRQPAETIERGEIEASRNQLQGAEAELRRLARDLEEVPEDLKALARRLAARQDQLANETIQALGEARNKPSLPAEEKQALAKRLALIAERQKAIAGLAVAMLDTKPAKSNANPKFPRDSARDAAEAAKKAAANDNDPANPREVEAQANNARNALHRLANEIPDQWQRVEPVRRAFAEARQAAEHAIRDAEQHLRESEQLLQKEPAKAARQLASRLNTAVDRAKDAAKKLAAAEAPQRVEPQRERAAKRATALAETVEAVRAEAPKDPKAPGFDAQRAKALRDALQMAATETRAAFDRLDQKMNGQVPADDVAAELQDEQRMLNQADANQNNDDRKAERRRLATALRGLTAPDAPLERAEAVRTAEVAAEGKDKDQAEAAKALDALANKLAAMETPKSRAEALARAERGLNGVDPAEAVRRQRGVAAELARLPRKGEEVHAAEEAVQEATDVADRASKPDEAVPGRGKPDPASQKLANEKAAEALDKLAATFDKAPSGETKAAAKPDAPRDPELALDPGLASKARELAQRERRLRENLNTILGERVAPQQDVRRDAAELGRELADLRDRAKEMSPRAAGPAHEAAAMLGEHAPRAMDEAANQLSQGNANAAKNTQRQAADLAERGAQNAEDLAAALRADRGAKPDGNAEAKHQAAPEGLAAAREAMAKASKQLGKAREPGQNPNAMDSATSAMKSAAEQLQTAAHRRNQSPEAMAKSQGEPSSDSPTKDPEGGQAGTAKPETLRELQEIVRRKTGRSWGELPGHLRTEILQSARGRYRDDYARLIQFYFQEIAAGAEGKP